MKSKKAQLRNDGAILFSRFMLASDADKRKAFEDVLTFTAGTKDPAMLIEVANLAIWHQDIQAVRSATPFLRKMIDSALKDGALGKAEAYHLSALSDCLKLEGFDASSLLKKMQRRSVYTYLADKELAKAVDARGTEKAAAFRKKAEDYRAKARENYQAIQELDPQGNIRGNFLEARFAYMQKAKTADGMLEKKEAQAQAGRINFYTCDDIRALRSSGVSNIVLGKLGNDKMLTYLVATGSSKTFNDENLDELILGEDGVVDWQEDLMENLAEEEISTSAIDAMSKGKSEVVDYEFFAG